MDNRVAAVAERVFAKADLEGLSAFGFGQKLLEIGKTILEQVRNTVPSLPAGFEDMIVAFVLAKYDELVSPNNPKIADWAEVVLESGFRKVLEVSLRALI